jgi:hypothetical protein
VGTALLERKDALAGLLAYGTVFSLFLVGSLHAPALTK